METLIKASPETRRQMLQRYLHEDILSWNFYRAHMTYFIIVILLSSGIIYGAGIVEDPSEINGSVLSYIDALFLSCSAMTTTGLNTVNMGDLTAFQQAWLAILLLVGNTLFMSTFIVIVRIFFFRKKLSQVIRSRSGRRVLKDIQKEEGIVPATPTPKTVTPRTMTPRVSQETGRPSGLSSRADSQTALRRRRRPTTQIGYGTLPAPWEMPSVVRAANRPFRNWSKPIYHKEWPYVSFEPSLDDRGRIHSMNEHERAELGGVEYRALRFLLVVLVIYQVAWLAVGAVFLIPYAYKEDVSYFIRESQPGNLKPGWWAFFTTITSFENGGLNLLNANFIPLRGFSYILLVVMALSLAGNTQSPVLLRFIIWVCSKAFPQGSRLREDSLFLLHHPRRCYLYLFPARDTWYLVVIQLSIDFSGWILFEILNIGIPAVDSIPPATRTIDGLFQAIGLRTSGAYIITISELAPGLLVSYLIVMYASSFPIVMALRTTNTYEERSIGISAEQTDQGGIGIHIRNQLLYDLWFQLLAWVLICIVERSAVQNGSHGATIFNIFFEVNSAYGTVGLSTGVPGQDYSLSGSFRTLSKLILMVVMLRGRHRGLPLAIDRSILIPGQDLFQQMDEEYNTQGQPSKELELEIRRTETESGRKGINGDEETEGPEAKQDGADAKVLGQKQPDDDQELHVKFPSPPSQP